MVTSWSPGFLGQQQYLIKCLENNANVSSCAVWNGELVRFKKSVDSAQNSPELCIVPKYITYCHLVER